MQLTTKHLFTSLLLLCATAVAAHDFETGGIYYNILSETDKTVEVTYKGRYYSSYPDEYTGSVVIPESVTYNGTIYSVTSIGYGAFGGCTGLTSITIPNSITSIGEKAFYGCTGLTSIIIPNSITSIGDAAFYGCKGLTSITIPNSVTSIGEKAFYGCSSFTSIEIPNSVTSIGNYAFGGCTGLTSATIGNSVTSIGNYAFYGCKGLTSITIPNSVTSIGYEAFRGCTGLESITIPNSITYIGYQAFQSCAGLTAVHIGDIAAWCGIDFGSAEANPLYYAKKLYLNGELLTELSIPVEIAEVKDYAFYNCNGVTNIDIVDGVKSIGNSAFYGCNDLETLYISNTIESIGNNAFAKCNNILDIKTGSKKAITASENVFSSDAYNNACLHVPEGHKFAYEKTAPWNKFYIVEMDFTGIESVEAEGEEVKDVYYDLSGRAVENPTNGVYIINGKKVIVK